MMQTGLITAPHLPLAAAPYSLAAARPGHLRAAEPVPPPVRRLFVDAEGLLERRRTGRGADAQTREDGHAAVPPPRGGRVFATSAYLSQVMAQGHDPLPEPRTPHRHGVAAYASLTLSVDAFRTGEPPVSVSHVIDLLA